MNRRHENTEPLKHEVVTKHQSSGDFAAASRLASSCLLLGFLLLVLPGCTPTPPAKPGTQGYFGPTETPDAVVARINARNNAVHTLWSRLGDFEVWAVNPQTQKTDYVNGSGGYLLYRAPQEFRFRGNKPGAGMIFEVGMNAQRYWLAAPAPGPDTMWWGTVGAATDPAADLPIRPELIQHVLALGALDTNPASRLFPLLRFNNDQDCYMLLFCRPWGQRTVIEKEVWYDRATLNPKLVILFDINGRAVLRAYLSDHRLLSGAPAGTPAVAAHYDLFFPVTRSRMIVQLDDIELQHSGAPNDVSFRFPGTDITATAKNIDAKPAR